MIPPELETDLLNTGALRRAQTLRPTRRLARRARRPAPGAPGGGCQWPGARAFRVKFQPGRAGRPRPLSRSPQAWNLSESVAGALGPGLDSEPFGHFKLPVRLTAVRCQWALRGVSSKSQFRSGWSGRHVD